MDNYKQEPQMEEIIDINTNNKSRSNSNTFYDGKLQQHRYSNGIQELDQQEEEEVKYEHLNPDAGKSKIFNLNEDGEPVMIKENNGIIDKGEQIEEFDKYADKKFGQPLKEMNDEANEIGKKVEKEVEKLTKKFKSWFKK